MPKRKGVLDRNIQVAGVDRPATPARGGGRGSPSGVPRGTRGRGWEVIDFRAGRKSPWLAASLSFLWPGLGQMYTGRWGKGFLLFFGQVANLALLFATVGFFSVPLLWLWGMVDAFAAAARTGRQAGASFVAGR